MTRQLNHIKGTRADLRQNNAFQFAFKHALEIYQTNAIYTFIPKNACSTMRYTLAHANGFISNKEDINWIHSNNATFNPDLKSLVKADYSFVILRCPFKRLASVFLDKFVIQEPVAFQYYSNTNRITNPLDLTFSAFANSLSKPFLLKSNIHWRPQVDFLVYNQYDDYFAFEQFDKVEETLMKKIGLKVLDARKLTNHGSDGLQVVETESFNGDTPIFELIKLKKENKTIRPGTLYNGDIFEKVSKIYAADIAFYTEKFGAENLFKL